MHMKRIIASIIACLIGAFAFAQDFTDAEIEQFNKAIELSDNGKADQAIAIYKELLKAHPTDTDCMYEIGYCLYTKQDYQGLDKYFSKLEKKGTCTGEMYTLHGNALDNMGKSDEAVEIYQKGLEKFPYCGRLYLELGMVYHMQDDLTTAVALYAAGIDRDPAQSSNYYRISQILCYSNEPALGMYFAESFQLMKPSGERRTEMSKAMFDSFNNSLEMKDDSTLVYNYTSDDEVEVGEDGQIDMPFGLLFEMLSKTPDDLTCMKEKGHLDIPTIAAKKKQFLETCFSEGKWEKYRLPVIIYEQKVLEAGHWDAFCHWLMNEGDEESWDNWFASNRDKFDAFAAWYSENPFDPVAITTALQEEAE